MTSIASLRMEIQTGDVTRASRELDKMTEAGKKAETQSGRLTSATGGMAQAMSFLKGAIAGIGIIELGRQFIGAADAMTLLDARMKLATKGAAEFASAQREVYRIAQTNMVGLQETATLYTRLADPVRRLGGTSRETSAIVEAFATSLRLSGASSGEAASATLQFSQAMASGALRGDEFNSVNEAAPRLMRAVAESLGVTTGELRSMAAEGKLTAGVVGNALAGSLQTLQAEAGQIPLTVGGAMQQVANETLTLVGRFNALTGSSSTLAEMVHDILTPAIRGLYSTAIGVVEVFKTLGTGIGGVLAAISAALSGEFGEARKIMGMLADDVSASWQRAGAAINQAWAPVEVTATAINDPLLKLSEAGTKTEKSAKGAAAALRALRNEQKALDDVVKESLDREKLRVALEQERQDIEGRGAAQRAQQFVTAEAMLQAIEQETSLLRMSNTEREVTVGLLNLEQQGVFKSSEAYQEYATRIREAIVNRDAVRRSVEQTKEIQREYEQMSDQIGQSLSDALMNGGKSAADYLKGLFRNLVLQPLLRPIGAALGGFGGMAGTASAATGGGGSSIGMIGSIAGISGAFGTGLASSFGSMAAAGVGGWASAAGSLLGSGSMAGFAAGAGMIAAPLIAAAVLASLFKGGETRAGGRYGMVGGQAAFLEGPSGGQVGPMAEAVQSAIDSINATLTAVGSQASVAGFVAGIETSKNSRGGGFAGGALSTGAIFGDTQDAVGFRYTENLKPEEAGARFARELQQATLEALQAADLGGSIGRMLDGVAVGALSDDALAGLSAQIQQTIASVTAFRDSIAGLPMDNLAGLSFDAAAALVEFSGGLESLQNNLGAYYQQFFSEEERVAALTGQLTAQLAALGFAMPETREGFRALVEAQDLTTTAGQRTYAALLGMADGFAAVVPATEILTDVIGDVGGAVTDVAETVEQALARIRAEVRAAEAIARNIIALEQQLYREQNFGNTAALRAQELDGLTAAEQALMRQIWAVQDAREAEARAAEEAARAAREAQTSFVSFAGSARNEWEGLVKSLYDEIRRIRGDLYGGGAMGYAQAQAQFAITSAKARAGDQNAAGMLPELSRTLLTLAEANATTLVELQRIRAQTVGSLQGTADLLGRRYGVPAMSTGTNLVPRDMLAMLHEGEAVVPKAYNPAAGGGSDREMLAELRAMNARLSRLETQATATTRHTERAAVVLDDASRGKRPLVTEVST